MASFKANSTSLAKQIFGQPVADAAHRAPDRTRSQGWRRRKAKHSRISWSSTRLLSFRC